MFKKILIVLAVCALVVACSDKSSGPPPEPKDLLEKLQALPGATVTEITPPNNYSRAFEILLTQPVDHNNPGGQQFQQLIYLSHIDEDSAMVMQISGYNVSQNGIYEMAGLLHANQVLICHRYFPNARPDPLDWQYLTIQQAAADNHVIETLLKQIYAGKWVSTGASKGGMAALFYRRFYPNDVDATVAYVAPLPTSTEDPRFDYYLENVAGDAACRHKIREFQRMALENKAEIIPLIQNYADQSGYTFTLPYGYILEMAVLEYPFAFWQYGPSNCNDIPEEGASAQAILNGIQMVNSILYLSEEYIAFYEPHYFQAYTQFGYYRLITDSLEDVLTESERYSYIDLAPHDVDIEFDPTVMPDIISWLQSSGDQIVYIYGEQDPWSAAAIQLTGQADALKIVQPFGDHSVRISSLIEKETVYETLEDWLGISINRSAGFMKASGPDVKQEQVFPMR